MGEKQVALGLCLGKMNLFTQLVGPFHLAVHLSGDEDGTLPSHKMD